MMRAVTAVLFDADGVLQRPTSDWWAQLTSLTRQLAEVDAARAALPADPATTTGR